MYALLETCQHPTVLRILYFAMLFVDIITIIIPIGLILLLMIDFSKAVISQNEDAQLKSTKLVGKRLIYAVVIFAVPWIVNVIMTTLESVGIDIGGDYTVCIKNVKAIMNETQTLDYYDKLLEEEERIAKENMEREREENNNTGTSSMTGTPVNYNYKIGTGITISNEPSPLTPLQNLYNITRYDIYNPKNFVSVKDKNSNYSLGAWPANANVSNLSGEVKTYLGGNLIFPVSGNGAISYIHNGIDIVQPNEIGVPIYAPVDGTIRYSEWGHTVNKGASETAYSVSIVLNKSIKYTGTWTCNGSSSKREGTIHHIFLTHMIGIKNRVNSSQTMTVKKGELIGFSGIANSTPHLHMTFYEEDSDCGLITGEIIKIYGLTGYKNAGE